MKRLLLFLNLSLVLSAQETALTDQRVMELARGGVQEQELDRLISTAPAVSFDLTPTGTQQMMQAGITEGTIKAMAARELGTSRTPVAFVPPPETHHHFRKLTWVALGITAGGLAYLGYALSNRQPAGFGCISCGHF